MPVYGIFRSLSTFTHDQGSDSNPVQSLEKSDQALEEKGAKEFYEKLPTELWNKIFEYYSFNDLLKIREVSKLDNKYASSFLLFNKPSLLRGYIQPNSPNNDSLENFSEILEVRKQDKLKNNFAWAEVYCKRVLSRQLANQDKPSKRIELLEKLELLQRKDKKIPFGFWGISIEKITRERLDAVQKLGLLNNIHYEADKADHIDNLTLAKSILEIIELESKGIPFNLSAFLKVRPNLLKSGMIDALDEFEQNNLTDERVSKICEFFTLLRPKTQKDNSYPEAILEEKLEELELLGLSKKNLDAIRHLIPMVQCGIFVNRIEDSINLHVQEKGITPLYYSIVQKGSLADVRILIAAGADLNRQNAHSGFTPLHSKYLERRPEIVRLLLDNGADANFPNCYDETPLTRFIHLLGEHTGMISLLLEAGAKIDRQDKRGWTAMHHAVRERKNEVVTLLLNAGADVDTLRTSDRASNRTSDGKTARELAREHAEMAPPFGDRNTYQIISTIRPLPSLGDINHTA